MHENVIKKLDEAENSDGYFITITILKDGNLTHYQRQQGFPKEDVLPSLEKFKKGEMDWQKCPERSRHETSGEIN